MIEKIKVIPRSKIAGVKRVEEVRLMNIIPYLGTTNVFNSAGFQIDATNEPCSGYEITPHGGGGYTIFVPATAVLAIKYAVR